MLKNQHPVLLCEVFKQRQVHRSDFPAIGTSHEDAFGSIRLTIDPDLTVEDADYIVDTMKPMIAELRKRSPLYLEAVKQA